MTILGTLGAVAAVLVVMIMVLTKSLKRAVTEASTLKAKIKELEDNRAIAEKQAEIANSPITVDDAYDKLFSEGKS